MSKKRLNEDELIAAEAVSKTEQFFEKNGKVVIAALVALFLCFGGGYAYWKFVWVPDTVAANELMVEATNRFSGENPNYELALNGDENGAGFLEVIEQYGLTPAGNIAKHYAGICYLHLNDLENAAKYLAMYSSVNGLASEIINAHNYGLQGDVAVEQGEYEKAAEFFEDAVDESGNNYTAALYLYKGGLAWKAAGDVEKAKECFETVANKFPVSMEARKAEMALGSL